MLRIFVFVILSMFLGLSNGLAQSEDESLKLEKELDSLLNCIDNKQSLSSKGLAECYLNVFIVKHQLGKKEGLEEYLQLATNELKNLPEKEKGKLYYKIANFYYYINNLDKSLAIVDLAIESSIAIKDSNATGKYYGTKAVFWVFSQGHGQDASVYVGLLKKSMSYFTKNTEAKARTVFRLAEYYYEIDSISVAEEYHNFLYTLKDSLKSSEMASLKIAEYTAKKNYPAVDSMLHIQLELYKKDNWEARIAYQYALLSQNSLMQGKIEEAIQRGLKGYDYAVENQLTKERGDLLKILIGAYEEAEDYKNALFKTRELDSILTSFRDVSEQLAQKDLQKNEAQEIAESEKLLNEKKSLELENKQKQQYMLFGGIGVFILLSFFAFRAYRQKRKDHIFIENQKKLVEAQRDEVALQKSIIEEAHHEITDSISYAERIQRSFLASDELLSENLEEYFVLFQPKEVVSGDFYWAKKMDANIFSILNADSTGHGVPGAIMSIVNVTSVEWSVDKGLRKPADIFNNARKIIIDRLKMDGSAEGGKDGMDASLISIDFENYKMQYVAANNPILIVRDQELIEIKGEKMPVGKHDKDQVPFEGGEIDVVKGDVIYTLTDGFQDQFGGEKGKKFKVKALKKLLVQNAHLPMNEQKTLLLDVFVNWMQDHEQIDDVCIIGVRI